MNYIPDKEANLLEKDLLGTLPYADTLSKIIETCKTPFTIGFLGGWGSGKSSVIKTIEQKFNDERGGRIKVFVYDAWKYSTDSFRRNFILQLKMFFNLNTTDDFDSFYKDKHEEIKTKPYIKPVFGLYMLLLFFAIIAIWFMPVGLDGKILGTFFTVVTSLFLAALKESFGEYKVSITSPRVFAPEQFEEMFHDIIREVTGKRGISKWIKELLHGTPRVERVVIAIAHAWRVRL